MNTLHHWIIATVFLLGSWSAAVFGQIEAVPITCDKPGVVSCAFVDRGSYVVHLVNNRAARKAILSGLPASAKTLRIYVTDSRRSMQESGSVSVTNGAAQLSLDSMSFTSVVAQDADQGAAAQP